MKAILSNRLYVPKLAFEEGKVDPAVLGEFEYRVVNKVEGPNQEVIEEVTLISAYNETPTMYGFCRGDIHKLQRLFPKLKWEDKRTYVYSDHKPRFITDFGNPNARRFMASVRGKGYDDPPATLRPDQMRAVGQFIDSLEGGGGGGILHADTGWGKSIASLYIITLLGMRTILFVEEEACGQNWLQEFYTHTNAFALEVLGAPKLAGFYGRDAKPGFFFPFLTVATYQSFIRNDVLKVHREDFGVQWVDEVDRAGAWCFSVAMNIPAAAVRGGCTATLTRNDGLQNLVYDVIGPPVARGVEKMLTCEVYIEDPEVEIPQAKGAYWWTSAITSLVGSDAKSRRKGTDGSGKYIKHLATRIIEDAEAGRFILVVGERNRLAFSLKDEITRQLAERPNTSLEPSDIDVLVGTSDRGGVIDKARSGACKIVLGQAKLLRRAINVRRWDCLYVATPLSGWAKSRRDVPLRNRTIDDVNPELLQLIGRIRRPMPGGNKPMPIVRDFIIRGDGRLVASMQGRVSAYRTMGFAVHGDEAITKKAPSTDGAANSKWF